MPRAKQVTMGKISPAEAHRSAIEKTIKLFEPYRVVQGSLVNSAAPFAVVYTAPRGGDRSVVMETKFRERATRLRDRLNTAWAEGFYSSGQTAV